MKNSKNGRLFEILSGILFILIPFRSLASRLPSIQQGTSTLSGWDIAFWAIYFIFGLLLLITQKPAPLTVMAGALVLYDLAEGFSNISQYFDFTNLIISLLVLLPDLCMFLLLLSRCTQGQKDDLAKKLWLLPGIFKILYYVFFFIRIIIPNSYSNVGRIAGLALLSVAAYIFFGLWLKKSAAGETDVPNSAASAVSPLPSVEERFKNVVYTESGYIGEPDASYTGNVFQVLMSIGLILGGASGQFVLRGTNSSTALVVAGFAWLVVDFIGIGQKYNQVKKEKENYSGLFLRTRDFEQSKAVYEGTLGAEKTVCIVRDQSLLKTLDFGPRFNGAPMDPQTWAASTRNVRNVLTFEHLDLQMVFDIVDDAFVREFSFVLLFNQGRFGLSVPDGIRVVDGPAGSADPSVPSPVTAPPERSINTSLEIPASATPCDWIDSKTEMLTAIPKTWGVEVKPYKISEADAKDLELRCPMANDIRTEQAQYAVEQSSNSVFWHEYGSWIDFKYVKFLYKGKLYYINVSPTVKLTQSMYDRKGDLNNMAKILVCLSAQAGADRSQLLFVLEGELHDQT